MSLRPPSPFVRDAIILFLALRAGDAINLAAGLWLVPKFVAPDALGAVLPVTTFATFLAIPAFAFAMTFMREAAVLAARGERGKLKSLVRGVFAGTAAVLALAAAASLLLVPRFLGLMRVPDAAAGVLVVLAALLGCFTPVYTDALNALGRFGALAAAEVTAAVARFATLAVAMPLRAFAGYFLGNAVQPFVRALVALFALRRDWTVPAEPFWHGERVKRLLVLFAAVTCYQAAPMLASLVEQSVLRTQLSTDASAGYYLLTRLSDLLNYLTLPLLMVLFPHAATATERGGSTHPIVLRCTAVTATAGAALALATAFFGPDLLSLLPQGAAHAALARHLPALILVNVLGAAQVFYTNAEVAAGRCRFLAWLLPIELAYAAALTFCRGTVTDLDTIIVWTLCLRLALFVPVALCVATTRTPRK